MAISSVSCRAKYEILTTDSVINVNQNDMYSMKIGNHSGRIIPTKMYGVNGNSNLTFIIRKLCVLLDAFRSSDRA